DGPLPAVPPRGARRAAAARRGRRPRQDRVGRLPPRAPRGRPAGAAPAAALRPRRERADARRDHAARHVPSEPAEHLHRPPHPADAPGRPRAGAAARRRAARLTPRAARQPRARWMTRPPATIKAPPIRSDGDGRSPWASATSWLTTKNTA